MLLRFKIGVTDTFVRARISENSQIKSFTASRGSAPQRTLQNVKLFLRAS